MKNRYLLLILLLDFGPSLVMADLHHGNPGAYRELAARLKPGDELQLAPGDYRQGLFIKNLHGIPDAPIVITGPASGPPAVLVARLGHNTVSIVDSSYVVLRNLTLDGRNLPVDGVKCEGHAQFAHHITLESLRIIGHSNNQQTVGISTKCPAWNWVIRGNVIEGAGTGMYLGNSDGRAPFIAGLIEHNLITDTIGYNLQIKHQAPRQDLPGMPQSENVTFIRHNVFSKAHGGSKELARPNVLVGHWPLQGAGASDRYLIYGNFFYQNPHEALFQGEGNIALYNNVFVNQFGDALRIQPHNDTPRQVDVFHNTILAVGAGIHLSRREHDPPYAQRIEANAVFAPIPLSGVAAGNNITASAGSAAAYLQLPMAPLGTLLLTPLPGKLMLPAETGSGWAYPDAERDFDGLPRNKPVAGAYGTQLGPRWRLKREVKPRPAIQ